MQIKSQIQEQLQPQSPPVQENTFICKLYCRLWKQYLFMVIISFLLQIDECSPSPAMNMAKKKKQEQSEHCENKM